MNNSDIPPSQPPEPKPSEDTTAYQPDAVDEDLAQVLDHYLADLEAGQAPSRERLMADHPDLADRLAACLSGIEFIHHAARPTELPMRLGDFQILGEIGRGGMGVVYEARQLSLNRRVALKVLRFGGPSDTEAMERFQREAETVAQLHHTNIVPIFAIGNQQGVSYYAMQFIEGRSLASVLEDAQKNTKEIDSLEIANWGLQAAEALAHAHQRGVIHRDVKPSNLILDPAGQIWLTDFGLAKRLDDVGLSMTGAMLGTPRYMSPEQASAMKFPVDQRTDIYSLGATLYELATGRPMFDADTPHGIIAQILTVEPPRPRQLRPHLPRDLETIILKCLAKEPSNRYATAQALVDDLRAFLQGWPIHARRASAIERAARWVRRQRRTVAVAAMAATAGALLVAIGFASWWTYRQSRLGYIALATDGPTLTAEILAEDGDDPVVPSTSVPTQQATALPEGRYDLRLSAPGLLSETWPLDVARGNRSSFDVRLHGQWLWPPVTIVNEDRPAESIDLTGRADLITYQTVAHEGIQTSSVRRLDGSTGKPAWPADLEFDESSLPKEGDLNEWRSILNRKFGAAMPGLLQPAIDLDGDGTRDLVWASRSSASLLAVSGKDGKILWWSHGRTNEREKEIVRYGEMRGCILGSPAVVDIDGDRTPDLVACFLSYGGGIVNGDKTTFMGPQIWVTAVSGRTGKTLWQNILPHGPHDELDSLAQNILYGSSQTRSDEWACKPECVRIGDRQMIVMVLNKKLWCFDQKTGEQTWPPREIALDRKQLPQNSNVGIDLMRPPQIGDWSGNRRPEALITGQQGQNHSLTLISLESGKSLWSRTIKPIAPYSMPETCARNWPILTDLDGNGRAQIIVPMVNDASNDCSTGIEVLNAVDGNVRWQRWLLQTNVHPPIPIRSISDGPDLNGDGCREVFVAFSATDRRGRSWLTVMALSGSDGQTLWRWKREISHPSPLDESHPLQWRRSGVDGWPELVVSVNNGPGSQPMTFILSAATGRLVHTLPEVADPHLADFDGDGIDDIFYRQTFTTGSENYSRLVVLRGNMPEPWRQLGLWTPAQDFDGDGVPDFLGADGTARSGVNGRNLWRITMQSPLGEPFLSPPLPQGDFDGDGVPDVVGFEQVRRQLSSNSFTFGPAISAFSGKDGHKLWTSDIGMTNGSNSGSGPYGEYRYPCLDCYDLNQDGRAELLVAYPNNGPGCTLSALSGQDGKLLWSTPIAAGGFPLGDPRQRPQLVDLDGDGTLDLLINDIDPTSKKQTLKAISGRDGRPLWPQSSEIIQKNEFVPIFAAAGDIDGNSAPKVVLINTDPTSGEHPLGRVVALDGRDGKKKWSWSWVNEGQLKQPPLLANLDGNGRRSVCVYIQEKGDWQIVVLDSQGQLRERIPLKRSSPPNSDAANTGLAWTAADLDGDGREELLYISDNQLCASRGSVASTLWKWPAPAADLAILDVRRCGKDQAPTVIVRAGRQVWGLSGLSGRPLWRCEVDPGPAMALGAADSAAPPHVWTQAASRPWSTVCRQAWPTNSEGQFTRTTPAPIHYRLSPPEEVRPLPWSSDRMYGLAVPALGMLGLMLAIAPGILISWAARRDRGDVGLLAIAYGMLGILLTSWVVDTEVMLGISVLVAVAVPVQLAYWAFRRKSLQLHLLVMTGVAAVLGAFLYGYRPTPFGPSPLLRLVQACMIALLIALATLPIIALIGMFISCIKCRNWSKIGRLLGLTVLVSLALALLMLAVDLRFKDATEQYTWDGWYTIWPLGTYALGAIAIFALPFRNLWRRMMTGSNRRPRRPLAFILAVLLLLLAAFVILLLLLLPFVMTFA